MCRSVMAMAHIYTTETDANEWSFATNVYRRSGMFIGQERDGLLGLNGLFLNQCLRREERKNSFAKDCSTNFVGFEEFDALFAVWTVFL